MLKRMSIRWASVTGKEFGRHQFHSIHNKKKSLKINSSLMYQRTEITGQTAGLNTKKTQVNIENPTYKRSRWSQDQKEYLKSKRLVVRDWTRSSLREETS